MSSDPWSRVTFHPIPKADESTVSKPSFFSNVVSEHFAAFLNLLNFLFRYHYGNIKKGRKGNLIPIRNMRHVFQFAEDSLKNRPDTGEPFEIQNCQTHEICCSGACLWKFL